MPITQGMSAAKLRRAVRAYGQDTLIGSYTDPVKAVWSPAEVGRVQTYLDEADWRANPQDIVFDVKTLFENFIKVVYTDVPQEFDGPYVLKDGVLVQRVYFGWNAVIRRCDPLGPGEAGAGVRCLAVLTQRT